MIDNRRNSFLHFVSFMGRAPSVAILRVLTLAAAPAALLLLGCSPPSRSQRSVGDLTSGHVVLIAPPEAAKVIERCRETFVKLYPKAEIEVRTGTSRDAIAALFAARADLAVTTRELLPEERRAAVQGRLGLEGYRFARDAAVLLTDPGNPVRNVSLEDVRRIYGGTLHYWSELGGHPIPIIPVVQPAGSDLTEFFVQEVLSGEPIRARSLTASSDEELIALVRRTPGAIGYASLAGQPGGAGVLKLAALRGLPYYEPDLMSVHEGRYPVTRFYNLYVRAQGAPLGPGFITFVTSIDGQRLVSQSGLVPTSVPVRFTRRSPMLSTHPKGDSSSNP